MKKATARFLKAGIEYGRGIRGGRRSAMSVLALGTLIIVYLLHRVSFGMHPRRPGSDPHHGPRPESWWPTGLDRYTGPAGHDAKPSAPEADKAYSIKPLAYIFPQFHPIPENDKFWGVNFTEWTNVKPAKVNGWGAEIQQPTDEIGYYNLLDYSTRARYARHAHDAGLYGFIYHHYWFGRPVMERVLMAMLEDGQPDMPFMLSWANEP